MCTCGRERQRQRPAPKEREGVFLDQLLSCTAVPPLCVSRRDFSSQTLCCRCQQMTQHTTHGEKSGLILLGMNSCLASEVVRNSLFAASNAQDLCKT